MLSIQADDARAVALVAAIHSGDAETLKQIFRDNPDLPTARIVDRCSVSRTLLHIVGRLAWPLPMAHIPQPS